jgi:hypothetical protein
MKIIETTIGEIKNEIVFNTHTKEIIKRHIQNKWDLKRISLLNVKITILQMIT